MLATFRSAPPWRSTARSAAMPGCGTVLTTRSTSAQARRSASAASRSTRRKSARASGRRPPRIASHPASANARARKLPRTPWAPMTSTRGAAPRGLEPAASIDASGGHVLEYARHARLEVVGVVAVEEPSPRVVGGELDAERLPRRNVDRVLQRAAVAGTLEDAEEMAVQVHRVPHPRLVDELELDAAAAVDPEGVRP